MIDDDWVSIESGNLFEKRKFRNNKVVEKQTELKTVTVDASSTPTTSPEAMMLTKRKNSCAHSFDENPWHCFHHSFPTVKSYITEANVFIKNIWNRFLTIRLDDMFLP